MIVDRFEIGRRKHSDRSRWPHEVTTSPTVRMPTTGNLWSFFGDLRERTFNCQMDRQYELQPARALIS